MFEVTVVLLSGKAKKLRLLRYHYDAVFLWLVESEDVSVAFNLAQVQGLVVREIAK